MEGIRHRSALACLTLAAVAAFVVGACASVPPRDIPTLIPLPTPTASVSAATPSAAPTASDASVSNEIPDSPMTTRALALERPQRGSGAPVGAVVFGTDVDEAGKNVSVVDPRTSFAAGDEVAWRVTLPAATGGESVRVTLSTDSNTETLVDDFVDQSGWNVFYGKSLLTVAPGTYVLHYLVDGHELGSGTFKIKPGDAPSAPAQTMGY